MNIAEFLLARIDEDRAYASRDPEPEDWCDRADGAHYDNRRVLAECEAKRRMVEYHIEAARGGGEVRSNSRLEGVIVATSWALHFLADVYSDHPDYDEAWRH